ncbi:uncharacterized protein [Cardiocondyla obscurior]|uniref:uncharacterized protein n=1 Tax=Cardiocondyla obscurior TaxID=286306 RepID=UPI0039656DF6
MWGSRLSKKNEDEEIDKFEDSKSDLNEVPVDVQKNAESDRFNLNVVGTTPAEQIVIPPFWEEKPELWFRSIEAQFIAKRITSDNTKFFTLVGKLDQKTLSIIEDLILDPPETGKFESLKTELLAHFGQTSDQRYHKLTTGLILENKKPSTLLREMTALSKKKFDAEFIRFLWLQKLPREMQLALVAAEGLDNSGMAAQADRLWEIQKATSEQISVVSSDISSGNVLEQVNELTNQLNALSNRNYGGQINTRYRPKAHNTLPRKGSSKRTWCQFHKSFGKDARNCSSPCSWLCLHHMRWGAESRNCTPPCNFKPVDSKVSQGNSVARQ